MRARRRESIFRLPKQENKNYAGKSGFVIFFFFAADFPFSAFRKKWGRNTIKGIPAEIKKKRLKIYAIALLWRFLFPARAFLFTAYLKQNFILLPD
jgi:hypothetical protein